MRGKCSRDGLSWLPPVRLQNTSLLSGSGRGNEAWHYFDSENTIRTGPALTIIIGFWKCCIHRWKLWCDGRELILSVQLPSSCYSAPNFFLIFPNCFVSVSLICWLSLRKKEVSLFLLSITLLWCSVLLKEKWDVNIAAKAMLKCIAFESVCAFSALRRKWIITRAYLYLCTSCFSVWCLICRYCISFYMPLYLLVDKNHKVICPELILPSVDRRAPPQSITAVEVEQHSERGLALIKHTKQHMLILLQFEQKFLSNMQCHRWLTLFCSSCTFPICQQIDWIHYMRTRRSGHCACACYVQVFMPVSSVLSPLLGCRGQSTKNNQGSHPDSLWPHLYCISNYCSQIMHQVEPRVES